MVVPFVRNIPQPVPSMLELDLAEKAADYSQNLSDVSVLVVPQNKARTGLFIVNNSASNMFVAFGRAAVANTGIRLNADGGSLELNKTNLYRGGVSMVAAAAGVFNVTIVEIETRYAY